MTDGVLAWAEGHRDGWIRSLKALRLGVSETSELRNGKRVNTSLETIAEQKRDLAELDALIEQRVAAEALNSN
jgi:hypothetical protein